MIPIIFPIAFSQFNSNFGVNHPFFHICFHPARHPIGDSGAAIQITSKPVKTLKFTARNGPFRKNIAQIFIMYITIPSWLVMIQQPQVRSSEEIPLTDPDWWWRYGDIWNSHRAVYVPVALYGRELHCTVYVCMSGNAIQCNAHIDVCMYACLCVRGCLSTNVNVCKCTYICICTDWYVYFYMIVYVYLCAYLYMYVPVCICMHACIYIYTVQALYKNSLYKKMRGWICFPHICFVEYIANGS